MEMTGTDLEGLVTAYLCDGCVEECKTGLCYRLKPDGKCVCRHTRDIKHALPCKGERKFARLGNYLFEVRTEP